MDKLRYKFPIRCLSCQRLKTALNIIQIFLRKNMTKDEDLRLKLFGTKIIIKNIYFDLLLC